MTLRTSSFWKCGKDPRGVSIARQVPQLFRGPTYWPLVPSWGQLSRFKQRAALVGIQEANELFNVEYRRQLGRLNPQKVAGDLGDNAVLLCWEHRPSAKTPCHRRIVAAWLEEKLGIFVPEVECHGPADLGRPKLRVQLELDFGHGEV